MERGLLPPHWFSKSPDEDLSAYVDTYLTEEIAAEGLARNLPSFARFLQTAAATNARMLNYTNVANDAQVPRQTVKEWFRILVDTLLGYELPAWKRSVKRKSIETAKFYFFDLGVVRTLKRIPPPVPESTDYGDFLNILSLWSCAPGSIIKDQGHNYPIGGRFRTMRLTSYSTTK